MVSCSIVATDIMVSAPKCQTLNVCVFASLNIVVAMLACVGVCVCVCILESLCGKKGNKS